MTSTPPGPPPGFPPEQGGWSPPPPQPGSGYGPPPAPTYSPTPTYQPPSGPGPGPSSSYGNGYSGSPGPQGPPPAPSNPSFDGFSIAGFVLSIPGCALFGLIFSIIGIVRTKGGAYRGRGLAIAGLIISILWMLFWIVLWILSALSGPLLTAGSSGNIVVDPPNSTDVNDLSAGDCLATTPTGRVTNVRTIPCDAPHMAQVVSTFDLPSGSFPGETQVEQQSEEGCEERLATSVESDIADGDLELYYYHPDRTGWNRGDRGVVCVVSSSTGLLDKVLPTG
jgi:hypothetical protein